MASRNLTEPLARLAAAARDIGARNFSRRVTATGSDEIVAVAHAFNEMATELENSETLRRNLVADVAHELRTPLSVLQGNLRAILDDLYPLDKAEIARLYTQTRLLNRLVNDLHELAQADAGQLSLNRQSIDLNQLVEETVAAHLPVAEDAMVTLQLHLAPQLPAITGDPTRLSQVVHNLLANALRHTPSGGQITVQTQAESENVVLTVQDTGEGIAPAHLAHLFDRFYRTDQARSRDKGGVGLGLAIVRALVVAHGGQVQAQSPGIDQGSTFVVTLPALLNK
jgi:signal transduction histidine kinase